MNQHLARYYTSTELVRIVDLAKRRMIDFNVEAYGKDDQELFKKMQQMKTAKVNRSML